MGQAGYCAEPQSLGEPCFQDVPESPIDCVNTGCCTKLYSYRAESVYVEANCMSMGLAYDEFNAVTMKRGDSVPKQLVHFR